MVVPIIEAAATLRGIVLADPGLVLMEGFIAFRCAGKVNYLTQNVCM
jgi:hypothetical protein